MENLESTQLAPEQKDLLYLAGLAYSNPPGGSLYNTRERLARVSRKLADWRSPRQWPSPASLASMAEPAFALPKEERLSAISELIGTQYFGLTDGDPVEKLLEAQSPNFVNYLIDSPDNWWYLLPALQAGLRVSGVHSPRIDLPGANQAEPPSVNKAARENLLLLQEIVRIGADYQAEVKFVCIPEASAVDDDFRDFWRGLISWTANFRDIHIVFRNIVQNLPKTAPTLDLGKSPYNWDNCYWKFDGHWSPKGVAQAAVLVADFVRPPKR